MPSAKAAASRHACIFLDTKCSHRAICELRFEKPGKQAQLFGAQFEFFLSMHHHDSRDPLCLSLSSLRLSAHSLSPDAMAWWAPAGRSWDLPALSVTFWSFKQSARDIMTMSQWKTPRTTEHTTVHICIVLQNTTAMISCMPVPEFHPGPGNVPVARSVYLPRITEPLTAAWFTRHPASVTMIKSNSWPWWKPYPKSWRGDSFMEGDLLTCTAMHAAGRPTTLLVNCLIRVQGVMKHLVWRNNEHVMLLYYFPED